MTLSPGDSTRLRPPEAAAVEPPRTRRRTLTLRALVLGLVLIPVNCYWVTVIEVRWYMLDGSCLPLFVEPVFFLFVLTAANLLLRALLPGKALSQGELLVVYILLVMSMTMCGHDMLQNLFGVIGHPFRFATPSNKWESLFWHQIPRWLFVDDKTQLANFYEGRGSPFTPEALRVWMPRLVNWGIFVAVLVGALLALAFLLSRPWSRDEKLSYPIIQAPLRLTDQQGVSLLRNRTMWFGFGSVALADAYNGLHAYFPNVPQLELRQYPIGDYFTRPPLNAVQGTNISFYPFMIGLAFFLPQDLQFSCWFFFVLRLVERVVGRAAGWDDIPGFPFFNQQGSGAWLGLAFIALWGARRHLWAAVRHALGLRTYLQADERRWPYVLALLTLVGGCAYFWFFVRPMGMTWPVAVMFFAVFFLLSIAMSRVRAELGAPHEIFFVNPQQIMAETVGTARFSLPNMTAINCLYWFNRCYRCHPMPNQVEALKMAEERSLGMGSIAMVTLIGALVAIPAAFWANLRVTYRYGAAASCDGFKDWLGWESFNRLQSWIQNPEYPDRMRLTFMASGLGLVLGLKALRSIFPAFPLHPAGYPLAISFAMDYFWFAFLISWVVKTAILRYGGHTAYRKSVPFFLGLILGDYVAGSVWAIIGPVTQRETYKIFI